VLDLCQETWVVTGTALTKHCCGGVHFSTCCTTTNCWRLSHEEESLRCAAVGRVGQSLWGCVVKLDLLATTAPKCQLQVQWGGVPADKPSQVL
jgi:hypothetical protein